MDEKESLALVVQKSERMAELQKRSVDAKKKKINDAIQTLFECCDDNSDCRNCPLYQNICWGLLYDSARPPYSWQLID